MTIDEVLFLEYEWDSNQVNLVLINQQIVFPRKQFAHIYYSIWSIIFLEIIIIKNMTNVYYTALFYLIWSKLML